MRVLGYIVTAIGVVSALFFDKYNGQLIPYPILFFILSILLSLWGLYLIYLPIKRAQKDRENKFEKNIKWLKKNGAQLKVDLKKCEVTSHKKYIEKPRHANSRTQAFDALYEPEKAIEKKEVIRSVIAYKVELNGAERSFVSEGINKDSATLIFLIENKLTTFIYYDSTNIDNYYFDLEFLED